MHFDDPIGILKCKCQIGIAAQYNCLSIVGAIEYSFLEGRIEQDVVAC